MPASKAPTKSSNAEKKIKAIGNRYTKTQIIDQIAGNTELTKKQVQAVLDELSDLIEGHVKKRGVGEFVLPGLMKITTIKKPARKARKGLNPFTGEEATFAAKPASTQIKIRPLKKLKDMAL
jgi:nucleoid DNA-binding protein